MSLADRFDHRPGAGFGRPLRARRPFRLSLGLVVVLALALGAVSFATWQEPAGAVAADR